MVSKQSTTEVIGGKSVEEWMMIWVETQMQNKSWTRHDQPLLVTWKIVNYHGSLFQVEKICLIYVWKSAKII